MAQFYLNNPIYLPSINGGERYSNGDIVDAEAINRPIEASYYAQELALSAKKDVEALNKKIEGLGSTPSSGYQWIRWNPSPISGSGNTIYLNGMITDDNNEHNWFKFLFHFTQNDHILEVIVPSYKLIPIGGTESSYLRKTLVPFWYIGTMIVYHAPVVVEATPTSIIITVPAENATDGVNCYAFMSK